MYTKIKEHYYNNINGKCILKDSIKNHCRFCGKIKSKKDFSMIAHAVSESVGNKAIISKYECDDCNRKFAENEENELGKLFALYKATRNIKVKKGVSKLKDIKFVYDRGNSNFSVEKVSDRSKVNTILISNLNEKKDELNLCKEVDINLKLVYRELVKFALSIVPEDVVKNWKKDIKY